MRKVWVCLFVGILGVVVLGIVWNQTRQDVLQQQRSLPQQRLQLGSQQVQVVVASTPAQIEQGLSGQSSVPADGMLFVLPRRTIPVFWMKEMHIPLDFVWIDGDTVVATTQNVPPPAKNTVDADLIRYSPPVAVSHVLEVAAGSVARWQITTGSAVRWISP